MLAHTYVINSPKVQPLASIIIVSYNSGRTIKSCIDSVLEFSRSAEIIVVDNGSSDSTRSILSDYDNRIRSILNSENTGFSRGCNTGILASCGKYVILLNPDTIVTPGWLETMLAHFRPAVGAVGPLSNYVAGLQKVELYIPGGLPAQINFLELAGLLGRINRGKAVETKLLIGFCLAFSRQILDEVGLLDPDLFLGNDDLEISWRLRQRGYKLLVATDAFVYHHGQASFKSEPEAKTNQLVQESTDMLYAKLVRYYGDRNVPSPRELWGMDWFKPTNACFTTRATYNGPALTTVVVLTLNQLNHTRLCLESIKKNTPSSYELIIVDNGSNDGTVNYLRQYVYENPNVNVITNDYNLGFAMGNNQAISLARGEFIVLLNNDTVVPKRWLERMRAVLARYPRTGVVGPMSNSVSGSQLVNDASYGTLDEMEAFAARWSADHAEETNVTKRIVGFCLMMRKEVVERIGGLDSRFGSGNFEDDDLCIRAAMAGFELRIAKDAFVHHSGGRTFRSENIDYRRSMLRNWSLFKEKWGIAPQTPLGQPYSIKRSRVLTSDIYIPLPNVAADHSLDADMRWWREVGVPKGDAGLLGNSCRIKGSYSDSSNSA